MPDTYLKDLMTPRRGLLQALARPRMSRAGAFTLQLLQEPKQWRMRGSSLYRVDQSFGLIMSQGLLGFDIYDGDFTRDLNLADRIVLWPLAQALRYELKFGVLRHLSDGSN